MIVAEKDRIILLFNVPLSMLLALVSMAGLFLPDLYARETANWAAQSRGQDAVDLFLITPALLLTGWYASRGYKVGFAMWTGVLTYLLYTFLLYCFDVHFNMLFPLYCVILGLTFYALVYAVSRLLNNAIRIQGSNQLLSKIAGVYFIVLSALFYSLWLSEILPAVFSNSIPPNVIEVGLPTNGVQVIDLAVFLPGMFIAGLLLIKGNAFGLLMSPVLLTFLVLMDLTIASLTIQLKNQGLVESAGIAPIMVIMALLSAGLLYANIRNSNLGNVMSIKHELR